MIRRRASSGLIYGPFDSGKTTNLGLIARAGFELTGKRSRLVSADNEYDTLTPLIDEGIIEPFSILHIKSPFPTLTKLGQGMWPVAGKPVGNAPGSLVMVDQRALIEKEIFAYFFEGLTNISELLLQDHISKGRVIGQDVVGKFEEEGIIYANSAQSHYGHVQNYVLLDLVPATQQLPVDWVWWTAHESKGEDEGTKVPIFGPGLVGKAGTSRATRKMGNVIHTDIYEKTTSSVDPATRKNITTKSIERRGYFEPHPDQQSSLVKWPAGVKIPATWIADWNKQFPDGFIPLAPDKGVDQLIRFFHERRPKEDAKSASTTTTSVPAAPAPAVSSIK